MSCHVYKTSVQIVDVGQVCINRVTIAEQIICKSLLAGRSPPPPLDIAFCFGAEKNIAACVMLELDLALQRKTLG
jgi:hypothetical protein